MSKKLEGVIDGKWSYVIERYNLENGYYCYTGKVPDLPGCYTEGNTVAEVLSKLRLEIADWLDHARREGIPEDMYLKKRKSEGQEKTKL
jgi:predicted RNase H-like HicB family nuclease